MSNETLTPKNLNYNFVAVPTNLFFALDCNLRNALTVLIQLSSVFADAEGFFFRTNEDLQADFKFGKNLTIAVLESLYRYGLLQVKSVGFTKKNGKKQVNFFKVNFERFKDFEKYHIYTITKNEELHLDTVDYKAKDFKVTYTACTTSNVETADKDLNSPSSPSNDCCSTTPSNEQENVSMALEMPISESVDSPTADKIQDCEDLEEQANENEEKITENSMWKKAYELVEPKDELDKILGDVEQTESPTKEVIEKVPIVETTSVVPTDFKKIEKRNFYTNETVIKDDEMVRKKCEDLIERFRQMTVPSPKEREDMVVKAVHYFDLQHKKGLISKETSHQLLKAMVAANREKGVTKNCKV